MFQLQKQVSPQFLNAAFAPIALAANTAPSGAKSNELKLQLFNTKGHLGATFIATAMDSAFLFKGIDHIF